METYRRRHTTLQPTVKGVALISVLVTGILVALAIAGLYYILMRTMGTAERVKTYTSVRDAAVSGVNHAVSQIRSGIFDTLLSGECPAGAQLQGNNCCRFSLYYRLQGITETFGNEVTLCLVGYVPPPGEQITGVAYTKLPPRGYIYSIVSVASGPQGSTARIEAVYAR
ncbi:hypothetical protein [Thermocrinis sp.]|uniref:hypothetical protein n=1 Tax=Thermocrinis sp. TaxID=2024383 RepID=UPI002FDD83D2